MNNGNQGPYPQYPQEQQFPQPAPQQYPPQYQQMPAPMPRPPVTGHRSHSVATLVVAIVMTVLFIGAGALAVWAYLQYNDQKTDVQGKVDVAVADAKKKQADDDASKFAQKEKEPNRMFVGPDDYGRVTFDYPKTWSVYNATDVANGGTFQAYLNPVAVPPVSNAQQFALRVTIDTNETDSVIKSYNSRVKSGDLKSSPIEVNGVQGTRLDGLFDKNTRGAAVIFKIRDKTLTIRTDANTFIDDFNKLVQTIKFNQ